MLVPKSSKSSKNFECKSCDYKTSRNSQFLRHLLTDKHKNNEKSTDFQQKSTNINQKVPLFACECGKKYKERTGLWRHKKVCHSNNQLIHKEINENNNNNNNMDIIKEHAKSITDKDELTKYNFIYFYVKLYYFVLF